jgi:hypothetical protein
VAQFAVGRTTYNLPLIAVMIGLALFVVSFVQSQRRAKAARLRSINLVKVEKKQPDASNRGTPATGTLAAPAGSADVPPPAPATPPPAPQPTTTSAYRKA